MVSRSVFFSPISSSLLQFPPKPRPYTLPPPPPTSSLAPPFAVPEWLFQKLLSVNYPITIALVYATTVTILNRINASRGNKPWGFSKTRAFFWFVILHNIFLAVYSGWTFVGMVKAVHRSLGPNLRGREGIAGAWDALCKIHGPAGLGNGTSFNETTNTWNIYSPKMVLSSSGAPTGLDAGRMWNEGLAFYGWIFYLSKFYEVLDTVIILAKGKRSSTLQTYHHAGAMLCMWAGIRYMAAPIFMFCLFNSCIHAMMYTYYTLTALSFRIPQRIKRTLTTLQISQFVIGSIFAFSLLFVSYTIPVQVPYTVKENVASAASSASIAVTSIATAAASAGIGSFLKKVGLRAAGEEGLAENIAVPAQAYQQRLGDYIPGRPALHQQYHTVHQTVPCVSTSGEAFAIWLNVFYLAPLTWLFVRFFIRSYTRRTSPAAKYPSSHNVEKAAVYAAHGVMREVNGEAPTPFANGNTKPANGTRPSAD